MLVTKQNYKEESFHLIRENKSVLQQSELKIPPESVVTQPSNVTSSTLCGSLPRQACLVYDKHQYVLDNKLLSHSKVTYLIERREVVGSKHYIAVSGRRYIHN